MQNFTFANSSEFFFTGWGSPEYSVTGYLPEVPASGALSAPKMSNMINNFMDGRVDIGKNLSGIEGASVEMFSNLFLDSASVSVSPNETDQGVKISFSAKE